MFSIHCTDSPGIFLTLAVILFSGFLMTRITKLCRLPHVTGYILAGILIGPHVLGLIPAEMIDGMTFLSDLALAFIAFGVGRYLRWEDLKQSGRNTVLLTLFESLTAGVLITLLTTFVFGFDLSYALIFGAIATATAPASMVMTIRQYGAKGSFVQTLLQTVALDNVISLMLFGVVTAAASTEGSLQAIFLPIVWNILAIAVGIVAGLLLPRFLTPKRSTDNRLILLIVFLLGIAGLCATVNISPLLSCMAFGTVYANKTHDKTLFAQMDAFTPPVMALFFILSGMKLDLSALTVAGPLGLCYVLVRILGKYGGAFCGCAILRKERSTRNWLGVAMIPQAGVAIGMAFLAQRILPQEMGDFLLTVILASSVLYEMIGPAMTKLALVRTGSIMIDATVDEATPVHGKPQQSD